MKRARITLGERVHPMPEGDGALLDEVEADAVEIGPFLPAGAVVELAVMMTRGRCQCNPTLRNERHAHARDSTFPPLLGIGPTNMTLMQSPVCSAKASQEACEIGPAISRALY